MNGHDAVLRRARRVAIPALLAAVLAGSRSVQAHEVGTTTVTVTLDAASYTIAMTVDPHALLARLDAAAGRPRTPRLTREAYPEQLRRRESELLRHVTVHFDGHSARPVMQRVTVKDPVASGNDDLESPRVIVQLGGDVPRRAATFTWSYGLTFVTYPMIVQQGGTAIGRVEWLDGPATSRPFDLTGAPLPGGWLQAFDVSDQPAAAAAAMIVVLLGALAGRRIRRGAPRPSRPVLARAAPRECHRARCST